MSCNNSGTSPKDGQAAKSDGTLIDLATISSKITEAVAFAKDVKGVHTLVKSIDELAKAIGKKIKQNAEELDVDNGKNNKNGELVAGAFQVMLTLKSQLEKLENKAGFSDDLKRKVIDVKNKCKVFVDKLKADADLAKAEVTDEHAQKTIDVSKDDEKGSKALGDFNKSVDELLKTANDAVIAAIKELTTSAKPSNT
ncbi:hypothetical protein bpSLO_001567 (plasmid) [Borrelia parkeri]|nr:hypothetical protein bpSLO_001567 [Borrelia parkeri]